MQDVVCHRQNGATVGKQPGRGTTYTARSSSQSNLYEVNMTFDFSNCQSFYLPLYDGERPCLTLGLDLIHS